MGSLYIYCSNGSYNEFIGNEIYYHGVNSKGERIQAVHPEELTFFIDDSLRCGGVGRFYVCLECLKRFGLDDEKGTDKKCPHYGSTDLSCLPKLKGKTCPRCKIGTITREFVGVS